MSKIKKTRRTQPEVFLCCCVGGDNPEQHAFAPLTKGYITLVSPEDSDLLAAHCWYAMDSSGIVYAASSRSSPKKQIILLHRVITGAVGGVVIDHENHAGVDNRRLNLRPGTNSTNAANMRKRKGQTSQFKGVSWYPRHQCWRAQIMVNYKNIFLGHFDCEAAAAQAYDRAAVKAFGEFALTNGMLEAA